MKEPKTIRSLFSQTGFVAEARLHGVIGDRYARVIRLKRRKKQVFALSAGVAAEVGTINIRIALATFQCAAGASSSSLRDGEFIVPGAEPCS